MNARTIMLDILRSAGIPDHAISVAPISMAEDCANRTAIQEAGQRPEPTPEQIALGRRADIIAEMVLDTYGKRNAYYAALDELANDADRTNEEISESVADKLDWRD